MKYLNFLNIDFFSNIYTKIKKVMIVIKLNIKFFVELKYLGSFFEFKKINLKERTKYMENINKIPSRIIEIETSIKLLEYLKRKNAIDDGMYNFCINKLLRKQELEKNRIDYDYINNIDNYKILT